MKDMTTKKLSYFPYLRLQDLKSISDYNSILFKITSQLKLSGKDITEDQIIEKIFYTFMPQTLYYNNNIKSLISKGTQN